MSLSALNYRDEEKRIEQALEKASTQATRNFRALAHEFDVDGQRLRRGQLLEQPPLLADVAVERESVLSQDRVEVLSLFGAHGDLPSVGIRPGSAPPPGSPMPIRY